MLKRKTEKTSSGIFKVTLFTVLVLLLLNAMSIPASSQGLIEEMLLEENKNLRAELTNLKRANAQLENEIKILSSQAEGVKKLREEPRYIKIEYESSNQENLMLKKQNEELQQKIRQMEQRRQGEVLGDEENERLRQELAALKQLNAQLETKAKELYLKTQDLEQKEEESQGLSKVVEGLNKERLALKKENEELKQRTASLESILQNEKAMLYEKLGTAYTQAKLFDLALKSYLKSLEFNPRNARVHYNLGLLYKHSKGNTKKSIYHLKKYLQLNPEAEDKKEVEYLIKMLSS